MQQKELEQWITVLAETHNEVVRFKAAQELSQAIRQIAKGLSLPEKRVWQLAQERGFERRCQETSNPEKLTTFFLMCMEDSELENAVKNGAQIDTEF